MCLPCGCFLNRCAYYKDFSPPSQANFSALHIVQLVMFEPFETINKQLWASQGKPPEADSVNPIARVGRSLGGSHEVNDGQHAESKRYEGGSQKNENEKVH